MRLLLNYQYNNSPLSVGNMLEAAMRRNPELEVYRHGEIRPEDADIVFNTLAKPDFDYPRGKVTIWWDIEACSYHCPDQFDSDIVLAPYTYHTDQYPPNTYFFPFATDMNWDRHAVEREWDVIFLGREDLNRTSRVAL